MAIRTSSMLIAQRLRLERYQLRLVQEAGVKAGWFVSAAEKTLASPAIAAWGLSNLAIVYNVQGRTKNAIALSEQALAAAGSATRPSHYWMGVIANRLALYLKKDGRTADAEIQFKRALDAFEMSGDRAPAAGVLNNLAQLYAGQRRYSKAVETAMGSLSLLSLGAEQDRGRVFDVLTTLGGAYYALGLYEDAELAVLRSCAIASEKFESPDSRLSRAAANLAVIYKAEGRALEAIVMFNRALKEAEIALGPDDVWAGMIANRLATTYLEQGAETEAEPLFKRAIAIAEKNSGEESLFLSAALFNLSVLYARRERYEDAEALLKRSLSLRLNSYGANHPAVEEVQSALSALEGVTHPPGRRDPQMTDEASAASNNAGR
jgi:tetratricopeptide (TPR) repeat protein